ncbi:Zn-dependent exopeptidase [Schizophyllum commune Loenen D]|nr:Zn-dependent exopeptidase [Schizophyllum commune Loenen D]
MQSFLGLVLLALSAVATAIPVARSEYEANVANGLRLLRLEKGAEPVWKSEDEKHQLKVDGKHFMDVTEVYERSQKLAAKKSKKVAAKKASYPDISHQDTVKPLLEKLTTDGLKGYLTDLTAFNNRYYKADTGKDASDFIFNTASDLASGKDGITVSAFNHSFTQYSIIAHIDGESDGPLTILGAHMDSINLRDELDGRAPGADDDGSGTVNLLEIFRVLTEADYAPKTPVEFQWYAGEEAGLLGSQDIATQYAEDNKEVYAMLQLDMTAYTKPGQDPHVSFMTDNVDTDLTAFEEKLVDEYLSISYNEGECGYGCSDHASWNENGYPSSMPFETTFGSDNPNIHSADDTVDVDGFSFEQSLEFAKLGLSYIVELTSA